MDTILTHIQTTQSLFWFAILMQKYLLFIVSVAIHNKISLAPFKNTMLTATMVFNWFHP